MSILNTPIIKVINQLDEQSISSDRKKILDALVVCMQNRETNQRLINLLFICTHNSRRSYFAQVWAQTFASYFNLPTIQTYSGGTEATALYPTVLKTLENQGFELQVMQNGKNALYSLKSGVNEPPIIGFSKLWNDTFNPKSDFIAVMTCGQADVDCPYIPGAKQRISLPFTDPKEYDGGAYEIEAYLNKSLEIATDLYYVFHKLASKPK